MRKRILCAFVLSLCVADFGAFAATRQGSVSAGTKIVAATENTVVPQDCQDAYYGCMDSFCMLDNASGGRCQCSDRITELDQALDEIVKLDEQTYLMATEGVERIQLGEAESQIISRANAAQNQVVSNNDTAKKKTTRTLDLSAWDNVAMIDNGNLFDDNDFNESINTFADKKGDALHKASASLCSAQLSGQCKNYASMLQLVYAQKVKSDCVAYENSLKVQKNQSRQKLQTAQKALRDAALEEYQNQNKYATLGECTIAFTQCMQTTAECGTDYRGCVIMAARENLRNNKAGSRAKQKKIKGAIHGADISLAASTMNQLLAKKPICESVTKQCVNANKNDAVWDSFLRNAAPALKSAELLAEQDLRANCLPTLAECFRNACAAEFMEDEVSYDACLSNPENYKSLCKVQLEPCLEATGGTYAKPTDSSLWNSLIAFLNAMRVDACTAQVKSCVVDACGDDFSNCIGLDTESIGNLCHVDSLTACVQDGKYADGRGEVNTAAIREYVAEVASGLALQIDNALALACQNALDDALISVCGDTEKCESMISKNLGTSTLDYKVCQVITDANNNVTVNEGACRDSVALISKTDLGLDKLTAQNIRRISSVYSSRKNPNRLAKDLAVYTEYLASGASQRTNVNFVNVSVYSLKPSETMMYTPVITGTIDWDLAVRLDDNMSFVCVNNNTCDSEAVYSMNSTVNRIVSSIESDPKVQYCMTGRVVQGFNGLNGIDSTHNPRFPNLTKQIRQDVADEVYATVLYNYDEKLSELESKRDEDYLELSALYEEVAAENSEKQKTVVAGNSCAALNRDNSQWNRKETVSAVYSESTKVCTKTTTITTCAKPKKANKPKKRYCKEWNDPVVTTETINM